MSAEPPIVAELKGIAGADEDEFSIVHQGVRVRVTYRGRNASILELRVDYDRHARPAGLAHAYRDEAVEVLAIRPMCLALRWERSSDRRNTREGIDVEHQTGDAAFDDAVYIDTPTVASVLRSVLRDDVRVAVLALFELEFDTVVIDDANGDVVAGIQQLEDPLTENPLRGALALQAFVDLVKALPRVEHGAGRHPRDPLRAPTVVAVVAAVVATFAGAFGCDIDRAAACSGPAVASRCGFARPLALSIGAVVSVVFGAWLYSVLAKHYSGTSSSSDRINALSVASSGIVLSASAYAVHHLLLK